MFILARGLSDPETMRLKALIGSEEPYDLHLSPLHQIVTGLSSADLATQIEMDPGRINDKDWMGRTPIMWSAVQSNLTHLRTLIAHNADPNRIDVEGRTALHFASNARSLPCVQALLDADANPNRQNISGRSALHLVAFSGLATESEIERLITTLVSHGADIEARDKDGYTPLSIAAANGHATALKAFAKLGANIDALDYGEEPSIERAIFLENPEAVHIVCSLGAKSSWDTTLQYWNDVLKAAALCGTVEIMDILASSNIAPMEYDLGVIMNTFENYRLDDYLIGDRAPVEEKLAAFMNLLEKKGIPVSEDDEDDEDDEDFEEGADDEDYEEGADIFADALEDLSSLSQREDFQSIAPGDVTT